jgi:hypothetical protein
MELLSAQSRMVLLRNGLASRDWAGVHAGLSRTMRPSRSSQGSHNLTTEVETKTVMDEEDFQMVVVEGQSETKEVLHLPHEHHHAMGAFMYEWLESPADTIRLIELVPSPVREEDQPGVPSSTIHCKLTHWKFGQRPNYVALSYTWGRDCKSNTRIIFIDGKRFQVGLNLWEALRFLKGRIPEKYLWVDAICINQNNVNERNQQLRLMPAIYRRAEMVAVWLGTSEHDFDLDLWARLDRRLLDRLLAREYWSR